MTRVLLVEDSPTDTVIVKRLLDRNEHQFELETAATGAQAERLLGSATFDCLVLDHILPDTNSLEFLRLVRERYGELPVVIITGQKHEWIRHSSMELGASHFLSKDEVLKGALPGAILSAVESLKGAPASDEEPGPDQSGEKEGRPSPEALYRTLLDTMRGGVLTLDGRGNITFSNPQAGELMGIPAAQLLGRSLDSFLSPKDGTLHRENQQEVKAGAIRTCELMVQRARQEPVPVHVSHAPLRDAEGAITGSILVLSNISDLRAAQIELTQSQARYRTLIEIAPEAIAHFNLAGNIQYHNQQLCRLTGYNGPELEGMKVNQILLTDSRIDLEGLYRKAMEQEHFTQTFQARILTKTGHVRHVEVSTAAMHESGTMRGIIAYVRDDTLRYTAERQIRQAKATAEFASDLLSHDINNLNQGTKGYLELLLEQTKLDGTANRLARQALEQVASSTRLIIDVRHLLDIRGQTPTLEPVDQVVVIQRVIEQVRARYPKRELAIEVQAPEEAPALATGLLEDLYLNLLDNGVKYNPVPRPSLRIELSGDTLRGAPAWLTAISDDGPGIPADHKEALFDRTTRRKGGAKGWGLGLSLVQAIVDQYEGKVWVEDAQPGPGACFKVLLPASSTTSAAAPVPPPPPTAKGGKASQGRS